MDGPVSMHHPILPLACILSSILMLEVPLPMKLSIQKISCIDRTIFKHEFSLSGLSSFKKIALVR